MKKIMMIGCGAMGGAILSGCLSKGLWTKEEVYVKASTEKSTVEKAERYGVSAASLKDIGRSGFCPFGSKARHYPFCFGRNKSVPPEAGDFCCGGGDSS